MWSVLDMPSLPVFAAEAAVVEHQPTVTARGSVGGERGAAAAQYAGGDVVADDLVGAGAAGDGEHHPPLRAPRRRGRYLTPSTSRLGVLSEKPVPFRYISGG